MAIKAKEVGKIFRYATGFDLSGSTGLTLVFTHSDGTTFTLTEATTPAVTAPASPVVDDDLGSLNASEYMQFTTIATTFVLSGTWTVCGVYSDATPKAFAGLTATFTVGEACE